MTIQIEDMRISFLWAQTILDHFLLPNPHFLNRDYEYETRFDLVRQGGADPLGLGPPWPNPAGHMFWTFYLEGKTPGSLSKRKAWKSLVPFRRKLDIGVSAPWFEGSLKILPEVFAYPHGQVVVLTFRIGGPLGLPDAIATAHRFRKKNLELLDGTTAPRQLNLNSVAETILNSSRIALFGDNVMPARSSPTPFSVFTVVRGTGPNAAVPIEPNGSIHRALEAWTSWRPTYATDPLPALSETRLKIRSAPEGHIVYGRKRGRAIWFPGLFTLKQEQLRSLGCYHRNQLMAAVQVESLGELSREAAGRLDSGQGLTGTYGDCAKRAGGALGRLYGGAAGHTYRSWSAKVHIEQNFLESVNRVRKNFNGTALSA